MVETGGGLEAFALGCVSPVSGRLVMKQSFPWVENEPKKNKEQRSARGDRMDTGLGNSVKHFHRSEVCHSH